jgi:hypothetical protein
LDSTNARLKRAVTDLAGFLGPARQHVDAISAPIYDLATSRHSRKSDAVRNISPERGAKSDRRLSSQPKCIGALYPGLRFGLHVNRSEKLGSD